MDAVMLVEALDVHGHVHVRKRITGVGMQCRIGRSLACDMVLDDAYAAPEHTLLTLQEDGRVLVQDLGTVNGTRIGMQRVTDAAGETMSRGELLIGRTRVRVRTLEATVTPERVFRRDPLRRHRTVLAVAGLALCLAFAAFMQWSYAPDRLAPRVLIAELVALAGLAVWVGLLVPGVAPDGRCLAGAHPHRHCGVLCRALGVGLLAVHGDRVCVAMEVAVGVHGVVCRWRGPGSGIPAPAQGHQLPAACLAGAGDTRAPDLWRRVVAGGPAAGSTRRESRHAGDEDLSACTAPCTQHRPWRLHDGCGDVEARREPQSAGVAAGDARFSTRRTERAAVSLHLHKRWAGEYIKARCGLVALVPKGTHRHPFGEPDESENFPRRFIRSAVWRARRLQQGRKSG